jgi:hypothetical protein
MAWFLDHGLPGTIRSDNGPQFRQSFTALCTSMAIVHETSSPYHPASNGLAEAAVKSMKRLLSKLGGVDNVVFRSALLEWRNTPRADGFSPAIGFFGRRLRTLLPSALPLQFDPATQAAFSQARLAADAARVEQKGGVTLAPLSVGDQVHVQDPIEKSWSFCAGEVTKCLPSGRSYEVTTSAGTYRRNRRHLRPATEAPTLLSAVDPPVVVEMAAEVVPQPEVKKLRRSNRNRHVSFAV